jgi:hypothetical protein
MAGTANRRRWIGKRLAAAITVSFVMSLAIATPLAAKTKPKPLKKIDIHALVACTGVQASTTRAFLLNQPADPNVLFNVITGFTRSKTKGARKEARSIKLASGDKQSTALNYAMIWCTDHGYTPRPQ